jgi:CRP/FNR family transcriptional regulator
MSSALKIWYLEQFNMMKKLRKEDILHIQQSMVMKRINKDTLLFFPEKKNDHIYFLKEGVVKIVHYLEDGREDVKSIIGPGSLFGELGLIDGESPQDHAIALEDVVVCFIDTPTMQHMMDQNHALKTEIYKIMGLRIKRMERRLSSMLSKDSRTRVIEFLEEYLQEYGREVSGKWQARNLLTHKDIGKLTATSRQTVTTVFNELKTTGMIDYDQKTITASSLQLDR